MPNNWEAYLMQICAQSGVPYSKLNLSDYSTLETKFDVNRYLFETDAPRLMGATEPIPAHLEDFITMIAPKVGAQTERVQLALTALKKVQSDARRKYTMFEQTMATLRECHESYEEALNYNMVEALTRDLRAIETGGKWRFIGSENSEYSGPSSAFVEFETVNDAICTHKDPLAKVDMTVNFGKFKVRYYPVAGKIHVSGGSIVADNYRHPHVDQNSGVCWGNAKETFIKAMKMAAPAPAFEALWLILTNYNADSPYVRLSRFHQVANMPPVDRSKIICLQDSEFQDENDYTNVGMARPRTYAVQNAFLDKYCPGALSYGQRVDYETALTLFRRMELFRDEDNGEVVEENIDSEYNEFRYLELNHEPESEMWLAIPLSVLRQL